MTAATPTATTGPALSDCAQLLVLMHDADRRLSSLQGEFEDWGVVPPSNVLLVDRDEKAGGRIRLRTHGPGLYPQAKRSVRRIWFQSPWRVRVELLQDETVLRLGVRDGTRWWRWDRREGTSSGGHDPTKVDTVPALLDPTVLSPARLLSRLRFEKIGEGVRFDRRVLLARAVPRDPAMDGRLTFEFEFDAEFGTMVRRAIFQHGKRVQLTEAREVHFGIRVDPKRFIFEPR